MTAQLDDNGDVSFENVRSYRHLKDAAVDVPRLGRVVGDVAWGGNWFFFTNTDRQLLLADVEELIAIDDRNSAGA